jgi:hypothetical protein
MPKRPPRSRTKVTVDTGENRPKPTVLPDPLPDATKAQAAQRLMARWRRVMSDFEMYTASARREIQPMTMAGGVVAMPRGAEQVFMSRRRLAELVAALAESEERNGDMLPLDKFYQRARAAAFRQAVEIVKDVLTHAIKVFRAHGEKAVVESISADHTHLFLDFAAGHLTTIAVARDRPAVTAEALAALILETETFAKWKELGPVKGSFAVVGKATGYSETQVKRFITDEKRAHGAMILDFVDPVKP